jgi:methionine-rich copper-binding protein CopC
MKIQFVGALLVAASTLVAGPAMANARWLSPTAPMQRSAVEAPRAAADLFGTGASLSGGRILLAHAILVKAQPDRDAAISDIPEEVLLIFNDAVGEEFLALAVVDESGKRVDNHDAKLDFTDHSHLRASVAKLTPGRYMVRYRVLSADGHVVSGKYYFQVQGK